MFYGNILTEATYKASDIFKDAKINVEDGDVAEKDHAIDLLAKYWNKILDKFADDGWKYIKMCRESWKDYHPEYKSKSDFKKAIVCSNVRLFLKKITNSVLKDAYCAEIVAEPKEPLDEHTPFLEVYFGDKFFKIPHSVTYEG